ncbi:E3 ubiquitin-protein ligase RNF19A-like [Cylas formicarius]|uniref:E3 ubiquitin-protein ligase RNF19A-like n=1 Tax=Cylas formicarius TaxID=197179 RepID=UPI0029585842|nr:E3 ubiquitin-protein ligase RNF19A-like [Cylas formicarius]XP_060523952.1 E3 ubiquitin-protein ligase RNF19A-like [Cylas formicarius]XP_060523954.1 E3 ubiquitin-protein ligase RNF19A-like [Cylas formicarius]XP_060523955.1 E3 ubiquitin-protein ligase RNF19A-like [Cylas formicarius]XP_060523956.1 E3 ubiquitin-protein ligase RNF19A-like [Cylas formicarius]XP_060523957.1 E3 ubiquitin-protein ligase RNF19A-like [Cylas formicarius]XP_060523958.1 E3 ubiquitin-protein ligase RNF19A-like [Cylas for
MRSSLDSTESGGSSGLPPCIAGQRKKRFPSRWSLRHLIYSSPLARRRSSNGGGSSKVPKKGDANYSGKDIFDGKPGHPSKENDKFPIELNRASSKTSVYASSIKSGDGGALSNQCGECPLCLAEVASDDFCELSACRHRACISCFQQYLKVEITESRISISCPECLEPMHPNEIRAILNNPTLFEKYEDFMVRRVLAVDPDTRWCPAPDCCFAVIASECASCPKIKCERPGCDSYFCYHCKAEWHPNQTCDAARAQRSPNIRSSSIAYSQDSQHRDDIKPCPRCQVLIVKMDDGSCNHMMCAVCGSEFCWLCMKEINDLHFLSPSGCTFWGKKPWSRKKKILWQLGTLVGAPVGIALVAGITVPAMIIGIPVWVGKKLYARYKTANKHKRNIAIVGGVLASIMISPLLAGLAVGIGVPILLFYVYGVVPVSLCRSGGCGGSSTSDDLTSRAPDATSVDAVSTKGGANPSIGEASLSLASGSQAHLGEADRESASMVALNGSINQTGQRLEVQADLVSAQRFSLSSLTESVNASLTLDDGGASLKALAGSVINYKAAGSDSCSCITTEDCTSERVRFDDNVSFIASSQAEKTSIGSSCSFRARCSRASMGKVSPLQDTVSNDSICIDIEEKAPRKYSSQSAILRSQFFHSINECRPTTKSLDEKTIMEVSNETLDKPSVSLIKEKKNIVICQLQPASSTISLDENGPHGKSIGEIEAESVANPLISDAQDILLCYSLFAKSDSSH